MTAILNLSIRASTFPTMWQLARLYPIIKCARRDDKANYRPISIICVLSKILEKHVHCHLYHFLRKHKLTHYAQSAFRKLHSCETALAKMASQWADNMNNGDITGLVFIDLTKAFDMVNQELLMQKLAMYKFSEQTLKWFKYLTERQQNVKFK